MGYWIFEVLGSSLALTLILELLFALATGVRGRNDMILVALVNVLTNPFVVLMYYLNLYYFGWNQVDVTSILEVGAVLVEGIYYKKYSRGISHPFLFSVGANVFSYTAGKILNQFF